MTTKEVFDKVCDEDFDVRNYHVDFLKLGPKLKTIKLQGAVVGDKILPYPSGLALIPLDPNSSLFRHGLFGKNKCSILTHRPFEVESFNNENTRDDEFAYDLCCYMVTDDVSSTSFGAKLHEFTRDSYGQYVVPNLPGSFVPLGAAILRKVNTKWSAGGLNSSTTNTSLPIWLSKENFHPNFCPGKYVQVNDTGFAPWRVRPHRVRLHYKISISSSPPTFRSLVATCNLITQWIKERGIMSVCDSIWLGANSIKLSRCGGE